MDQLADAATMRQWALRCFTKARESEDEEERERLHTMGVALLEVAQTRDWLDGRSATLNIQFVEIGQEGAPEVAIQSGSQQGV